MILRRYLNLEKYVFLLKGAQLHCPRGDQFKDKFEGSYPYKNKNDFNQFGFKGEDWKKFVTVSCWHKSEHESDAMWQLYGLSKNCVAVVTTRELLESLAEENGGYIQEVRYINYTSDKAEIFCPTDVFHYKRIAFAHESEVRLIKTLYPPNCFEGGLPKNSLPIEGKELPKEGELLDVELGTFLTKIIVSPDADKWFYDVVKNVTNLYGVNDSLVICSELSGDPIYATP